MLKISECHSNNLCIDCDNWECSHCGDIAADCPKYSCDNDIKLDCNHCEFIKDFQKEYRKSYR